MTCRHCLGGIGCHISFYEYARQTCVQIPFYDNGKKSFLVIVSTICVPTPKWMCIDQHDAACHGLLIFLLMGVNMMASGWSIIPMKIVVNLWTLDQTGSKLLFVNQASFTPHIGFIINLATDGYNLWKICEYKSTGGQSLVISLTTNSLGHLHTDILNFLWTVSDMCNWYIRMTLGPRRPTMLVSWSISIVSVCAGHATLWGTNNIPWIHKISVGKMCAW